MVGCRVVGVGRGGVVWLGWWGRVDRDRGSGYRSRGG